MSDSPRHGAFKPTFELEAAELALGNRPIAGVDEAGRGPWAGPVVAAAVILDPDHIPAGIDDSKALDEDMRETVYARICASSRIGVGIAEVTRIDRDNILAATLWAMSEAVSALAERPRLVLIDGNKAPRLGCDTRAIVKGDAKCLSIAAASIVAKVTRDRLMCDLARAHPGYGFERHKGYGTPEHKAALVRLGVTALHRRSFRPVQLALGLPDHGPAAQAVDQSGLGKAASPASPSSSQR
jgi:ribonuclease HII